MPSDMPAAVQANLDRLKRYQTLETHITRLLGGWMPGIARWEVKKQVAYHLWENMESSRDLRTRLWELRITNPDRGVDPQVIAAVEQLALAQHDHELIAGIYLVLKPALLAAYQDYVATTFDIYDYPSVMALRPIISRTQEQIAWGKRAVDEMTGSGEERRQVHRWVQYAQDTLAAIGGVNGDGERADLPVPPPAYSLLLPFAEARRDERFDVVIASPALQDKTDPLAYLVWQFSNYVQEMQAAETLATTLWEVRGMAWEFYYDIARHLWDEVRHSELGENRLKQLGYHITDFPNAIGSYGWRQLFDPVVRYCALTYIIEAGSFKMKHESYQRYLKQGDIESAQAVMYDIMDETMHVRFGQKWVTPLMQHYGFTQPLPDFIEECRQVVANHSVAPAQRDAAQAKA